MEIYKRKSKDTPRPGSETSSRTVPWLHSLCSLRRGPDLNRDIPKETSSPSSRSARLCHRGRKKPELNFVYKGLERATASRLSEKRTPAMAQTREGSFPSGNPSRIAGQSVCSHVWLVFKSMKYATPVKSRKRLGCRQVRLCCF